MFRPTKTQPSPLQPICPGVYLATQAIVDHFMSPLQLNIGAVVLCSHASPSPPPDPSIRYFTVFASDDSAEDIQCFFDPVIDFIQNSLHRGNVAICSCGGSRSAAISMAYLMKIHRITLEEAYSKVCEKCGAGPPNRGFLAQLTEYAQLLGIPQPPLESFSRRSSTGTCPIPIKPSDTNSSLGSDLSGVDNGLAAEIQKDEKRPRGLGLGGLSLKKCGFTERPADRGDFNEDECDDNLPFCMFD